MYICTLKIKTVNPSTFILTRYDAYHSCFGYQYTFFLGYIFIFFAYHLQFFYIDKIHKLECPIHVCCVCICARFVDI